jgi:glycosyltransferase involved in cell wall biosynthesis
VVEVHGDWRASTRLYGSRARAAVAPLADRVAAWSLRRADRVRVIGTFARGLVDDIGYSGPLDVYPAFTEYDAFLHDDPVPAPQEPVVLFVGSFARVKGVDVLLDAWPEIAERVPAARMRLVGSGSLRRELERRSASNRAAERVEFVGPVAPASLASIIDASSVLVLPSRSEGLGRVLLEAFARGRPVVASRVGGIPDVVSHNVNGLLVAPDDPHALADALVTLLSDDALARRLGTEARRAALEFDPLAEFEVGIANLARWARS